MIDNKPKKDKENSRYSVLYIITTFYSIYL